MPSIGPCLLEARAPLKADSFWTIQTTLQILLQKIRENKSNMGMIILSFLATGQAWHYISAYHLSALASFAASIWLSW